MAPERNFTDADIKALRDALKSEHCKLFTDEQASALRSFAEEIKKPETRRALITASEWANDGSSMIRKWLLTALFLGALATAVISGWLKIGK